MKESTIERKLRQKVRNKGGLAIKMTGIKGIPDRLILMPQGLVAFCELKAPEGVESERQKFMRQRLRALGFISEVVRTDEDIDILLGTLKKRSLDAGNEE